jgi:hypothetical protein
MAESVSMTKYEHLKDQLARVRAGAAKVREHLEGAVPHLIGAAEVFAGGAFGGFIDEKWGTPDEHGIKEHKIAGVPTNLGIGGLLILASAFGIAGKQSHHTWDVGKGFVAAYGVNLGRTMAAEHTKAKTAAAA